MRRWIGRYLSMDDAWSVLGYVLLVALTRLGSRAIDLAAASLLASGMLAVFWLASGNVRARNAGRYPNARVLVWALIAIASALMVRKW